MSRMIFSPFAIGNVTLKNRYVMAPMGNLGMVDANGAFTQRAVDYFVARAQGGVGLIITGLADVAPEIEGLEPMHAVSPVRNPRAFKLTAIEMVERVHAWGCKIFLQLSAGFGYAGNPGEHFGHYVAPSETENRWDPNIKHRALTRHEIYQFIDGFARSADIAKSCGFDGVEIHAVHEGYLLDQFTMAFYNQRTDEFGGSEQGRLKFPQEVVKAIKARCGEDYPVALRFSLKSFIKGRRQGALPGECFVEQGRDIEEGLNVARQLVAAGYDALDVDVGTYDAWYWNHPPMYFGKKGIYLEFARQVKEAVDVPVIVAGRMDDDALAEQALREGKCDLVSLGRPLLADPDYPNKIYLRQSQRVRPCLSCHEGCMGRFPRGGTLSCAVNPACGREAIYQMMPAAEKKNIVVVGAGIAGMEVARVAATRGHRVTIYEQQQRVGGVVIPGSQPSFKSYDRDLLNWYETELKALNVAIHFSTTVTPAFLAQLAPDVAVIATGSTPVVPEIPGMERLSCLSASDVLMNPALAGERCTIIGAGLVGAELALWLKQLGRQVEMVEFAPAALGGGKNMPFMNYDMLRDLLAYHQIPVHVNASVSEVYTDGVQIVTPEGSQKRLSDTLIYAVGYRPASHLYEQLTAAEPGFLTYQVGDARKVNNIMYAIWDGYELGRSL